MQMMLSPLQPAGLLTRKKGALCKAPFCFMSCGCLWAAVARSAGLYVEFIDRNTKSAEGLNVKPSGAFLCGETLVLCTFLLYTTSWL